MDDATLDGFATLEARRATPDPVEEDEATLRSVRELTEVASAVVGSPQHHAILELTHLDSSRPDVNWIARVLGMQPDEVNVALQHLSIRCNVARMARSQARPPAEALQLIARFRRELIESPDQGRTRDGVYHLEISFGPLSGSPPSEPGKEEDT
jgi:hypothetical protein